MELNYELDTVIEYIKKNNYKTILLQLPDGLKPQAQMIQNKIKEKLDITIYIWMDSCFGACDTPNLDKLNIDEIIQFGHSKWI